MVLHSNMASANDVAEGNFACDVCNAEYPIHNGIPRFYRPDDEIIAMAGNTQFPEFIITPQTLNLQIKKTRISSAHLFFASKHVTKGLLLLAWALLALAVCLLILQRLDILPWKCALVSACLFIGFAATLFGVDYARYRVRGAAEYSAALKTLKRLAEEQALSEYDIRSRTPSQEERFKKEFESQNAFVAYKGKKIASLLERYGIQGKTALNIGCGGKIHHAAAKPYFDKHYDMTGVDISEDFLNEFKRAFFADAVQANSMALPFKSNQVDLINFTDLLEHLHHPQLGLSEAQRVLKRGGLVILTTNNRSVFTSRCVNPLIFLCKALGLSFGGVLPPRNILGKWMDFNFYHTEFTREELRGLLKSAGLEIVTWETHFPNKEKLNTALAKLPVLRFMASKFLVVARKA